MTSLLLLLMLQAAPVNDRNAAGRFISERFVDGSGNEHSYRVFIPSAHDGTERMPLIIALHGCTQDAQDFATGTRLNQVAERDRFLIAYPEQTTSAHPTKCWNWFLPAHQQRAAGEIALIAGITRQVQERYRADTQRTWLLGISAGAAMASLTAAAYPDLYGALALHSGVVYGAARDLPGALAVMRDGVSATAVHADAALQAMGPRARLIPTIVFHGGADAVLAARNGEQAAEQWLRTNAHFGATTTTTSHGTSAGGYSYTRTVHADASGRPVVELWLVKELGHAWSGGDAAGTYTDAKGPDATAEMLRFFRAVTR